MKSIQKQASFSLVLLLLITSLSALSGCSATDGNGSHSYAMAPMTMLPEDLQAAPETVREAYQFAIANQEMLKNFPCYCGCGGVGHENNLDCYIQEVKPDGTIIFENHAFG